MFMRMVYDEKLAQAAYVIGCQRTGEAIVIDPERDVDRYIDLAKANGLRLVAAAETHIHADFLSGSRELAERVGACVYLSDEGDADWKYQWLEQKPGGGSYDHRLLKDGDLFSIGQIEFRAVHTPGHTPEHMVFVVTDRGGGADAPIGVATGDFMFVGDVGRPDLLETAAGHAGAMEPSARRLYSTLRTLDAMPDFVQVWPGHGAGSACGKALGAVPTTTLGYERRFNPALRAATSERAFVDFILSGQPEPPLYFARMKRDNKLGPKVLGALPSPARLSVEQFRALDARCVAIIDTRAWEAFRDGHVPASLWFPLNKAFNTDAGSMISEDEPIVLLIDEAGVDEAVRDLVRIGLDRVVGWYPASEVPAYADGTHALATVPELSVADAAGAVARGEVAVLDVRRAAEAADGRVSGSLNIAHTRLASRLAEVPQGKPLLVHCRSGVRSGRSAALLIRSGYPAMNLAGGMLAWEKAGAPVEK